MPRQLALELDPPKPPPAPPRVIKALTLHQPWASAWAARTAQGQPVRRHQLLSWDTGYRGWLAIHAAREMTGFEVQAIEADPAIAAWLKQIGDPGDGRTLPFGKVIAVGRLEAVTAIEDAAEATLHGRERAAGEAGPAAWAWRLGTIVPLPTPLPALDHAGLWNWPVPRDLLGHLQIEGLTS